MCCWEGHFGPLSGVYVCMRSQKHMCVCIYKRHLLRASMQPHPQNQAHAPAQVMGVPARGHRVPRAQSLLCRPRALRVLVFRRRPWRFRSQPYRAAHPMSYLTAHTTHPSSFVFDKPSPLVHEPQRSRSEAVRSVTHSHVCVTRRWQQQRLQPAVVQRYSLPRRPPTCCDLSTRCQPTCTCVCM